MRRQRNTIAVVALSMLISAMAWSGSSLTVAAATVKARASSASDTDGSQQATDRKLRALEEKLDQVLANQQTILQKFDAVMEELRIVKVRVSLRGS